MPATSVSAVENYIRAEKPFFGDREGNPGSDRERGERERKRGRKTGRGKTKE